MDITKWLYQNSDSVDTAQIVSNEGMLDVLRGKSKPSHKLIGTKDAKNVFRKTYQNPAWLEKFNTTKDQVVIHGIKSMSADYSAGWNKYKGDLTKLKDDVISTIASVGDLISKATKVMNGGTDVSKVRRLEDEIERLGKLISGKSSEWDSTKWSVTLEPIDKGKISALSERLAKVQFRTDKSLTDMIDAKLDKLVDAVTVDSPLRKRAYALDDQTGDDVFSVLCVHLKQLVNLLDRTIPRDSLNLNEGIYASYVVMYINRSLR